MSERANTHHAVLDSIYGTLLTLRSMLNGLMRFLFAEVNAEPQDDVADPWTSTPLRLVQNAVDKLLPAEKTKSSTYARVEIQKKKKQTGDEMRVVIFETLIETVLASTPD